LSVSQLIKLAIERCVPGATGDTRSLSADHNTVIPKLGSR
jgi:hypothetical protein